MFMCSVHVCVHACMYVCVVCVIYKLLHNSVCIILMYILCTII